MRLRRESYVLHIKKKNSFSYPKKIAHIQSSRDIKCFQKMMKLMFSKVTLFVGLDQDFRKLVHLIS